MKQFQKHRLPALLPMSMLLSVALSITTFTGNALASYTANSLPVCLHIASYKPGYDWQDGIDRGLQIGLQKKCQLYKYYMDSKQISDATSLVKLGQLADEYIKQIEPDILIFSDDNAVKYVLKPFYKNSEIPSVFCGVNHSGKPYGLPYKNTSGMVEKAKLDTLLHFLVKTHPLPGSIAFIIPKTTTSQKIAANIHRLSTQSTWTVKTHYANTVKEWRKTYQKLNEDPTVSYILIGNTRAIEDWESKLGKTIEFVKRHQQKLSATYQPWMMNVSAIGLTKSSEEQGVWAGSVAREVLQGVPINQIPEVVNRHFDHWKNIELMKTFPGVDLPNNFIPVLPHLAN